jgi:hypothetical protein
MQVLYALPSMNEQSQLPCPTIADCLECQGKRMAREIVPFIDAATAFGERATGLFVRVWMGLPNAASPSAPITPVVCHRRVDGEGAGGNLGRNEKLATEKGEKLSAGC